MRVQRKEVANKSEMMYSTGYLRIIARFQVQFVGRNQK